MLLELFLWKRESLSGNRNLSARCRSAALQQPFVVVPTVCIVCWLWQVATLWKGISGKQGLLVLTSTLWTPLNTYESSAEEQRARLIYILSLLVFHVGSTPITRLSVDFFFYVDSVYLPKQHLRRQDLLFIPLGEVLWYSKGAVLHMHCGVCRNACVCEDGFHTATLPLQTQPIFLPSFSLSPSVTCR